MIAHQSDQQPRCHSLKFSGEKPASYEGKGQSVQVNLQGAQSEPGVQASFCGVSVRLLCTQGHGRASSCPWTVSAYSRPLAAFNAPSRLIRAPHAHSLPRPSPLDMDRARLVPSGDPSSDAFTQQDTAPSVLLHLRDAFKSLHVWAPSVSAGRRCSTSQHVQPGAKSRSAAHNWIQRRVCSLGVLLLRAREPKGRESGCAPAF